MIHATRSRRPEIVLFGRHQRLRTPLVINAGNQVMVTSRGGDEITVSKFSANEADQKRVVSTELDEVIRAVVDLGGTYPDVVQALQEAKTAGALPSRFEIDALPEAGREYNRVAEGEDQQGGSGDLGRVAGNPMPQSVPGPTGANPSADHRSTRNLKDKTASGRPDSDENPHPPTGFFAKMMGRGSG